MSVQAMVSAAWNWEDVGRSIQAMCMGNNVCMGWRERVGVRPCDERSVTLRFLKFGHANEDDSGFGETDHAIRMTGTIHAGRRARGVLSSCFARAVYR